MADTATRVGVCGFGRCGSSMLMAMLAAGGLPPAPGAAPTSGEHPSLADALTSATPGRVVKLLDLPLAARAGDRVDLPGTWSLVWLDRDPRWQAESFRKFARWGLGLHLTVRETRAFRESLERDRGPSVEWLIGLGHPVLTLTYEDVLTAPSNAAAALGSFLPWAGLDVAAMAAVVHQRQPRVLPDMAIEEATASAV